ncbi:MAG: hypothetical protein HZA89_17970 [Verrucomicrobia bacterium]|nr:hypothetical protein [Verrucomicrobiota bacterium]
MKLYQGQVWKRDGEYLRIVRLERLAVEYKSTLAPGSRDGTHHQATKKEFCRLLKTATLLGPVEMPDSPTA